jgi:hypothetical protein
MNLSLLPFQIPRRCNLCQECQSPFENGENYFSRLTKGERQDFCAVCWNDESKNIQNTASNCQWNALIPLKKAVSVIPQTKQQFALAILKELLADSSQETHSEALVLALYLARKKVLLFRRDYVEDNQRHALFEVASTEEMLCVKRVPLDSIDLVKLQSVIAAKLNSATDMR